jgi:hypothetical protein
VYQAIIEKFSEILAKINPLFLFILVILSGLYVFWRGCSESRKNNSSIFDTFFISSFFGLIFGRISYIITHWENFSSYIWYWLPYEKYGNEVFLFRVLPWRFFRLWDWGIDILLMFLGFILVASFWILVVKKWKWSHLFNTIYFTAQIMLAFSFFLLGGYSKNNDWMIQGIFMMLLPLTLLLLKNSVRGIMIGKKESKVLIVLDVFFIFLTVTYIAHTYLTTDINHIERVGIITFITWTALGTIFYILDSRKDNVTIERVSSVSIVSPIDINQPIKLPK